MALTDLLLKRLLFRPVKLKPKHQFRFNARFSEYWIDTTDGLRINALYFPTPTLHKQGLVLYFHGNRDNLQRWGAMHRPFTELGYDFLIPDYRGYGKSEGEPDEHGILQDADLLYQKALDSWPPEKIILYGRSLGSGPASYLAARRKARMLILETPFDHVKGLVKSHLRREKIGFEPSVQFPNVEHLRQAALPILIFHGTRDLVVPYACAVKLKAVLKPGDLFITIQGGSHNNLGKFPEYQYQLEAWLGGV